MQQLETKAHIEKELPDRLVMSLYELAQKYQQMGARLFVFGSFANFKNSSTSDLDLGVIWSGRRSHSIFLKLYGDVQELPTIRKIDLVDMGGVDEAFKTRVMENPIFFLTKK